MDRGGGLDVFTLYVCLNERMNELVRDKLQWMDGGVINVCVPVSLFLEETGWARPFILSFIQMAHSPFGHKWKQRHHPPPTPTLSPRSLSLSHSLSLCVCP